MISVAKKITRSQFCEVIFQGEPLELSQQVLTQVEESHSFLKGFAANRVIYGVNTGFGPMAQYRIQDEDRHALQYNLIRSHAAGTGELLSPLQVKATMLTRLANLSKGKSGVHV